MTQYPNPTEPYDPDGLDPDPFGFPFGLATGEPVAGYTPNQMGSGTIIAPEDAVMRVPGAENPGPTRLRRGQLHKLNRKGDRDIFG